MTVLTIGKTTLGKLDNWVKELFLAKKVKELPDLPSAMIQAALVDIRKAERSPRYKINMVSWHETNSVCSVCLGGAVMAFSLAAPRDRTVYPDSYPASLWKKLHACDYFRKGDIEEGLESMGYLTKLIKAIPDVVVRWAFIHRDHAAYSNNPKLWYKQMRKLVRDLKAIGL